MTGEFLPVVLRLRQALDEAQAEQESIHRINYCPEFVEPCLALRTIQAHRKILDEFDTLANDRRRLTDAAMHLQFSVMGRVVRDLASIYFPESET